MKLTCKCGAEVERKIKYDNPKCWDCKEKIEKERIKQRDVIRRSRIQTLPPVSEWFKRSQESIHG